MVLCHVDINAKNLEQVDRQKQDNLYDEYKYEIGNDFCKIVTDAS